MNFEAPGDMRSTNQLPKEPEVPSDNRVLFYQRDKAQYFFLSNFYYSPFGLEGQNWPTVEHYYQAQKSSSAEYRSLVDSIERPGAVKRMSAGWLAKNPSELRFDWHRVRLDVMTRAVRAKFHQNAAIKTLLIGTGTAVLEEDSPRDEYWGLGLNGRGENMLGYVLMLIRVEFADHCK